MHDPEEATLYREYARKLLSWAEQTYSNEERRLLLAIAVKYHQLAKYLEDHVDRK